MVYIKQNKPLISGHDYLNTRRLHDRIRTCPSCKHRKYIYALFTIYCQLIEGGFQFISGKN